MLLRTRAFKIRVVPILAVAAFVATLVCFNYQTHGRAATPTQLTILYKPGQPNSEFVPSHAFGAAIDGHEKGEIDRMLSQRNLREMLSAGLKPISYRLRTELAGEAWHWNPEGQLRDGYWVSSSKARPKRISVSYGYRLPRRGNTFDQANDDSYSRIDDADPKTFWKSNPYLDQHFTGEPNASLAQWVLVDLGKEKPVNAIRLQWGLPFATKYDVQYGRFTGVDDISQALPDQWQTFPHGAIVSTVGRDVELRLSDQPIATRFVRLLLKESSHTSNRRSSDVRDRLGYSLREISVGTIDATNHFHDEIRHTKDNATQTPVYVSSTDSWHRSSDIDDLVEQPGFDRIFSNGLTNGLPMLTPVGVLYNSPENAAAELRYLKNRGYRVERLELGEEPDGQFVTPEDFAALYIQFAKALHQVDPNIKLGGPSFQDIAEGKDNWLERFVKYLRQHGHIDDFTFASFEWYPFDNVCKPTAPQLREATSLLNDSLKPLESVSPRNGFPWIMTEYGYSAFGSRAEIDLEGALLNADAVANFLTQGGEQAFLYGYEPNYVLQENACSPGNNMLFIIGDDDQIAYRMPTYYGARLLTQQWAKPGDEVHELYQVSSDNPLVTAYAVLRPDKLWSLLLVNKDPDTSHDVQINLPNNNFSAIDVYQYSRKQYQLGGDNRPSVDLPPEHQTLQVDSGNATYNLPPYSLTVVRGSVSQHNST